MYNMSSMSSKIISCIPENDRKRFESIINDYYKDITIYDISFMNIDDFLRFVPNNSVDSGMAGLLWKRYLSKIK